VLYAFVRRGTIEHVLDDADADVGRTAQAERARVETDRWLAANDLEAALTETEARLLGADFGVEVEGTTVRARAIGHAIVGHAIESGADLIVLGSAPRWRRQSRFFSPTVDYVLRRAPCEVLIVAFPQPVVDAELAAT
jgi:nucleotide-binding universal stress UspA family protein